MATSTTPAQEAEQSRRTCVWCGGPFTSKWPRQKTCSTGCSEKRHKQRKRISSKKLYADRKAAAALLNETMATQEATMEQPQQGAEQAQAPAKLIHYPLDGGHYRLHYNGRIDCAVCAKTVRPSRRGAHTCGTRVCTQLWHYRNSKWANPILAGLFANMYEMEQVRRAVAIHKNTSPYRNRRKRVLPSRTAEQVVASAAPLPPPAPLQQVKPPAMPGQYTADVRRVAEDAQALLRQPITAADAGFAIVLLTSAVLIGCRALGVEAALSAVEASVIMSVSRAPKPKPNPEAEG